ncbi:hypothetical protein [Parabacteroides gordonii]|uniref:hypothetical protein n=1 Tax=Parabacteroides gordonii TaxID=574930 RepID=UPI00293D9429|nr:hypothetical protein [Parabacteroides gordonii]
MLYDLTALQKDCNVHLDLSAEKTLAVAQSLYERNSSRIPVPEAATSRRRDAAGSRFAPRGHRHERVPGIRRHIGLGQSFHP